MRILPVLSLLLVTLIGATPSIEAAVFPGPIPVSPGRSDAAAAVAYRCPTFSWSGVPGAWGYEIAIFHLPDDGGAASVDPLSAQALVRMALPSQASSWTPSLDQCLPAGARYAWFVRETGGPGRADGVWSAGAAFDVGQLVPSSPWTDEEIAGMLHRWMRARSDGLPTGTDDIFDDIWGALAGIATSAGNAASNALNAANRATTIINWTGAIGTLEDVKTSAATLLDLVREGRRLIDGTAASADGPAAMNAQALLFEDQVLRQLFEDAAGMIRGFAHDQAAGVAAFVASSDGTRCGAGSQCAAFRSQLILAFTQTGELLNAAAEFGSAGPVQQMSLNVVTSLLNQLPGPILYLLYRADQSIGFVSRLATLQSLTADLRLVTPLFARTGFSTLSAEPLGVVGPTGACLTMAGNENAYRNVAYGLLGGAIVLKGVGKLLEAIGETRFHGEVGVAVVDGALQSSPAAKAGKVVGGVSEVLGLIGGALSSAVTNCRVLRRFDDLEVLADELDADIANLKSELENVDTTLASIIASLNTAASTAQITDIERQLASCRVLVTLYLPAVHGGSAETVVSLVRRWIDAAAGAGVNTKSAEVHYSRSLNEAGTGEHIRAFRSLCSAYGALTN